MIVRVLQGRVHAGQVGVFRGQAQEALEDARRCDGLIYAQVGRQAHSDGSEEIVFVTVWRYLEALYCWVGGTDLLDTPVLNSGSPEVFERFEVQHYDTYESPDRTLTRAEESSVKSSTGARKSSVAPAAVHNCG